MAKVFRLFETHKKGFRAARGRREVGAMYGDPHGMGIATVSSKVSPGVASCGWVAGRVGCGTCRSGVAGRLGCAASGAADSTKEQHGGPI